MLRLWTKSFSQSEWTSIISGFQDQSLMQTWEYAEATAASGSWRAARSVLLHDDIPVGVAQALVRTVPILNRGVVWMNQGPLWRRPESSDVTIVPSMMAAIRKYWVDEQHMYLRVAPPITSTEIRIQDLTAAGYRVAEASRGWCSSRIDLSKSLDHLRAGLKRKWRGDLNSAERHGVTCEFGSTQELLESFLTHYEAFLDERGFATVVTPQLLRRLQSLLSDDRKMIVFEGRLGTEPLGGLLIARYGDTALALAGSSPNARGRSVHSGNFVWWQSMLTLKELGYRWLDTGGTDPQSTLPGILHFKAGMGASEYQLIGEFESDRSGFFERAVRWQIRRSRSGR
jgi:lipid II:glycine glycyltransferase (peptidoglycan interpeptide bridge formation enzyme)